MGLLEHLAGPLLGPLLDQLAQVSTVVLVVAGSAAFLVLAVVLNVLKQLLWKNPNEPPIVFHWFPVIGNTITYGMAPYDFFKQNQKKYGDIFTFILLGKKTTVYLGTEGNDFILNGKLKDVCAEDIYTVLTTPVFGKDVVYDCPNAKLMEQKKFMKIGLTSEAFRAYVPQITEEVNNFIKKYPAFKGSKGTVNIDKATAEITIYTASRTLQGKEVRDRFDSSFADLYHDLDMGFSPINFMLHWAPLPHNRARDHAQRTIAKTYMDIINERRAKGYDREAKDIMLQLMHSSYKNGKKVPDVEIAHMMIALLMAGQHSSASSSCWIMLRLASRPDVMEAICEEQLRVLNGKDLEYEDLAKMPLIKAVINETLRLHTPIHSIMRAVKSPMPIPGTNFIIPTDHVILSSPGVTSQSDQYFPQSEKWDPYRWIDRNSAGTAMAEEEFEDYGFGMISKGAKSPFLPFGAGRHRCIGEQFGMVQLSTITIAIVREFKFRNVGGKEGVVDTDYSSLFSKPLAPCVIEWERRTKA